MHSGRKSFTSSIQISNNRRFLAGIFICAALALSFWIAPSGKAAGSGAISLMNFGVTVSENFDSLSSTSGVTTATVLPIGWYLAELGTGTDARRNDAYAVGTGSSNIGDTYSFGITGTNPLSDRAFGTLRTASLIPYIGAQFTNNTGGLITSVIITYTGEMWRAGTTGRNAADTLAFQYSTDAISLTSGTWISQTNLDFLSPVISTTVSNHDGNNPQFRMVISSTITGLSIPTGSAFWIRWVDLDISGPDDGLAVDDFFLTPFGYDTSPIVASTNPISNAVNVPITSSITITFNEPVNVSGSWYKIFCGTSGSHTASVTGGPLVFTLNPTITFSNNESCASTVFASLVTDQQANPMASDFAWSFTTGPNDYPPSISSTNPISNALNVAVNANIVVTFSEPVNVAYPWFTIGCSTSGAHTASVSGGATTFTLNPSPNFANNESCTVTILASQVTDQDFIPPNHLPADYAWNFTTAPNAFRIHTLQGATHTSPYSGTVVSIYDAIVTAKFSYGFFLQERDVNADPDPNTSEGIFVRTSSSPNVTVSIGDSVNVFGMVTEYRSGSANLSRTEIDTTIGGGMVEINSFGNALPLPITIGAGGLIPPTTIIENDNTKCVYVDSPLCGNIFDPNEDGIDFYESLESMLVQVNNAVAVGPTKNAEVAVLADNGGNGAGARTARGGLLLSASDFNPERLILASSAIVGSVPKINVGGTFAITTPITGVLDYDYDNFKLQVTAKPITATNGVTPETTASPNANQLAVVTFNLQNLRGTEPTLKFDSLAAQIVNNLQSPDLLLLQEIGDNDGPTDSGIVSATVTMSKLISAIGTAGGPTYDYRQVDPVNDQDGGAVGSNIRVVFLFRSDRGLSFVDRPCSGTCNPSTTATYAESIAGSVQLHYSPGRIDPNNAAWSTPDASRKPLAGEFLFRGNQLFVINNHWKSKLGDDPIYSRFQPPTQFTQVQRNAQAAVVKNFVDSILALNANAKIIVAGDLNAFEFSQPITISEGTVMHALVKDLPQNERYDYNLDGNSETLDHILVSNWLYNNASPQYDIVHINSEFATQFSDHDPSIVRLTLTGATNTTLTSSLNPAMVGQSVTLSATVSLVGGGNRPQRISRPSAGCGITGTIQFKEGTTILGSGALDSNCNATFTTSSLAGGLHNIVAVYDGDGNYTGSASLPLPQLVITTRLYLPFTER